MERVTLSSTMPPIGRFAPSPTGPLHLGSLVAAVGSFLAARAAEGRWLVRMEDLDTPRLVAGSDREILRTLELYALHPDGEVVYQSQRLPLYEQALRQLHEAGLAYECSCSRADLRQAASAPALSDLRPGEMAIYPGTCRNGLAAGRSARAIRFRVPEGIIFFRDRICGEIEEEVATSSGDFVVRRADGPFAYQLAVVVDDGEQGVTQVVRGGDLLSSTARQIALQVALELPTPSYAHLPLVVGADGSKLGKREGALPLPALNQRQILETLRLALSILGVAEASGSTPSAMLSDAVGRFNLDAVPRGQARLS